MSQTQDTELFQKLLVGFGQEEDPIKDMLQLSPKGGTKIYEKKEG